MAFGLLFFLLLSMIHHTLIFYYETVNYFSYYLISLPCCPFHVYYSNETT